MRRRTRDGRQWGLLLAAAAATGIYPPRSHAASIRQWVGGTSDFNTGNNWSTAGVLGTAPGAGDSAEVTSTLGLSQTLTYDYAGTNFTLGLLTVDLTGGVSGVSETFSLGGTFTFVATSENIGGYFNSPANGVGTFNQSGGVNSVGIPQIGYNAGDQGNYLLSAGTLSSATEYVGFGGAGFVSQGGGLNFIGSGNSLRLAQLAGASGNYLLTGGTLSVAGTEYLGNAGPAVFNQSGGFNTVVNHLPVELGVGAAAGGTYLLSGTGSLSSGSVEVGVAGSGVFNQSGGAVSITNNSMLFVAANSGSTGTFILSGGNFAVSGSAYLGGSNTAAGGAGTISVSGSGQFSVAGALKLYSGVNNVLSLSGGGITAGSIAYNSPFSQFNWTGGTVDVSKASLTIDNTSAVSFGCSEETPGTLVMSGSQGLFVGENENVGFNGTGSVTQNAGASGAGQLNIGVNGASVGSYSMSAGSMAVTGNAIVGGTGNSTGTLTVSSSGQLIVGGMLQIASGTQDGVNLTGGSITAGTLNFNSPFTQFNWTGGTLDLSKQSVTIDNTSAANFGSSQQMPGTLVLSGSQGFFVGATENVGFNGTGSVTQSAGASGAAQLNIGVNGSSVGSYAISAGSMSVAGNAVVGGTGNSTGTLTVSGTGQLTVGGTLQIASGTQDGVNLSSGSIMAGAISFTSPFSQFNWAAGTVQLTNQNQSVIIDTSSAVNFGDSANSTGTFVLSSAQMLGVAGQEIIGDNGTGSFNNAGQNSAGVLVIGLNAGSTGTYVLAASGQMSVSNALDLNNGSVSAAAEIIGAGTSANGIMLVGNSVNQTGGANTIGGELDLQGATNLSGIYNLSGGTLSVATSIFAGGSSSGAQGTGTLAVSGTGQLIVNNGMMIYSGSVSATDEFVGGGTAGNGDIAIGPDSAGGVGTVNQSAGINSITSNLNIGTTPGSNGTYILGGGTVSVGGTATIGGATSTGTLTLGGTAQLTVGGTLHIASGTQNVVNLNGGSITAGAIGFNCPFSQFNWAAGTVQLTNQNVIIDASSDANFGDSAGTTGTFALSSSQKLGIAGEEIIGDNGTGSFNNAGQNSAGVLVIGLNAGSTGTYVLGATGQTSVSNALNLYSGSLSAGTEAIGSGTGGNGIMLVGNSANQIGGTNTISGELDLQGTGGSSGIYNLSGGTLSIAGSVYAGGSSAGAHGTGTLAVSGTGQLIVNNGMALFGGSVSAIDEYVGGGSADNGDIAVGPDSAGGVGSFNQSAGINLVSTNLNIGTTPGSNGTYILSGGTLSVGGDVHIGGSTSTGTLKVSGTGSLSVGGTLTVDNGASVTIGGSSAGAGGLVILANGILNVNTAITINLGLPGNDPIGAILAYLQTGYNTGTWTGTAGIVSSNAAANPTRFALGYADGNVDISAAAPNQVLIKYTLAGDANLDGNVDFNDLFAVGKTLNTTGNDWSEGNFNYASNGLVDFNDLFVIGQNFNRATGSSAALLGSHALPLGSGTLTLGSGTLAVTAVPEPSSAALLWGAAGLLARRKRRGFCKR